MFKASLFILVATVISCGFKTTPLGTTPPVGTQTIFVDPSISHERGIDPINIKDALQIGEFIVLDVSYSGGCEEHDFRLETKGDFTSTYPPELKITLKHDSKKDACRAIVDKKIWFDLKPAQFDGTNRVLLILTNTDTTLEYNY